MDTWIDNTILGIDALILHAAKDGNVDELRFLASKDEHFGFVANSDGMMPLHYASCRGNLHAVEYLVGELPGGVDVEAACDRGWTALHGACYHHGHNNLSVVRYLVKFGGANVEARTKKGDTPLHLASHAGHEDIVHYLVEQRNANVNTKNGRDCKPLDDAFGAFNGGLFVREDIVRLLLPKTSSVSVVTLCKLSLANVFWKGGGCPLDVVRRVLQKFTQGRILAEAFRQNPVHTLFSQFPSSNDATKDFQSWMSFQKTIKCCFPSSALSLLDEQGRFPIHVALTSRNPVIRSPPMVALLFEREPSLAMSRDPTTGLYPHETAAGLAVESSLDDNDDESGNDVSWLDIVYRMLRSNPQPLLQSRAHQERRRKRRFITVQKSDDRQGKRQK